MSESDGGCTKYFAVSPSTADLQSLGSGEQRVIQNSCSPWPNTTNEASCPSEFEEILTREGCNTDSIDYGSVLDCDPYWLAAGAQCGRAGSDFAGHCEFEGYKSACRRLNGSEGYRADPVACCLAQGTVVINNLTCNPNYRNGSACAPVLHNYCNSTNTSPWTVPACNTLMQNNAASANQFKQTYCNVGDRIFTDSNCSNWINTNATNDMVKAVIINKCNSTNLHREPCQTYIKDRSRQSAEYDALMTSYCRGSSKNAQLCSCINSADSYANDKKYTQYCKENPAAKGCKCLSLSFDEDGRIPSKPVCLDPKCATPESCNGGVVPFKTHDMNVSTCNYVQCKQIVDDMNVTQIAENSNTVNVSQAMNCGISPDAIATYNKKITDKQGTTETSGTNLGGDGSSTTTVSKNETKSDNGFIIYILLFVLILAIVAGVIYKFKTSNKSTSNKHSSNKHSSNKPSSNKPSSNKIK